MAKLDEYWDILMRETPFYYAAVVLHPNKKLAWFRDKWRRYPDWLKTVENGMKELVASYSKEWEDNQAELRVVTEPRLACRKLTVTRHRERERRAFGDRYHKLR